VLALAGLEGNKLDGCGAGMGQGIGVELRGHKSLCGWEGCVWQGRLYEFGGVSAWGDGNGRVYAMAGYYEFGIIYVEI
jgi:hypothetical protein